MKHQLIRPAIRFGFGLIGIVYLYGCLPSPIQPSQTANNLAAIAQTNTRLQAALEACHQEDSGWSLVRSFETAHYSLALCQQGKSLHLLGQEKNLKKFIKAAAQVDRETIVAEGSDRFSYEIRQGTLTVKKRGDIIVQEGIE